MREIDKTIILMASKIVSTANIFVLSIFFARMLLKADYGTYIQVNMLIGLMVLLLSLGIPPSMFYFLPKDNNQKHLIKRTFLVLLSIGCLSAVALYFLRAYVANFMNNEELTQYVFLAGICIICRMSFNLIQPILMVLKKSIALAGINIFKGIFLFTTMTGCLVFSTGITILIYVFVFNYIVEFIISLWAIIRYSNHFSDNYNEIIVPLRTQFKFALPLAISGVLWLLGRETDKYIVAHYLNPEDLAIYARGAVEIPLVQIFAATIAQVYLPNWVSLFDKKEYGSLLDNWHLTIAKTALIMFPVFIIFQIIGYDFIVLMYSSEYAGSVPIFMIYLFLVPLQVTEYTAVVESSGKTILISLGYFFQISLNIIFSILLLKHMGSKGPALVTVMSMYLWVAYILFILSRIFKVGLLQIFPWRRLLQIMMICVISGILPFGLKLLIDNFGILNFLVNQEMIFMTKIIVIGIIYSLMYLLILFLTRMLDSEDKNTIYRWLMIEKIKKMIPCG